MPQHHLFTLGVPQLRSDAGEQVRFRTRKHLALVIRLAVESGKRLSRDYLQELLWPEVRADLARPSLAQAISVLKAKVGREHLVVQRATVALVEGAVDVDIQRLETPSLEVRGRFLEGFEIPEARAFEQWKDEWQGRVGPRGRGTPGPPKGAPRRGGGFGTVGGRAPVLPHLAPTTQDAGRRRMAARAVVG